MTYGRYLALDPLLTAQHAISDEHDELLFVIIHQTKQLWLKQAIAELQVALDLVRNDKLVEAYKSLARLSRIQAVMTLSWEVLTTMTPSDYTGAVFTALAGLATTPLAEAQLLNPGGDPRARFLALRSPQASAWKIELKAHDIVTDVRGDVLRIGFGLYHDDRDVKRLLGALGDLGDA